MAVTIDVPPGVLERAAREWDDAGDRLAGADSRLDAIDAAQLSGETRAAVTAFTDVWSDEVTFLARRAASHARDFEDLETDLELTDAVEAARMRSLLPYVHHDAVIRAA